MADKEQETAMYDQPANDDALDADYAQAAAGTVTDQFSGMSDRELSEWTARRLAAFEKLAAEAMSAAETNPMARMLMGNMFPANSDSAPRGGILGLLGKRVG